MANHTTIQLSAYFTAENLDRYFKEHLLRKKGGGRDHLTPGKFLKRYKNEFEIIAKQCVLGKYQFGFYREKLVIKNKNRLPRVLAIPTMRDRLVLGVLNQYLKDVYNDSINNKVPNRIVNEVLDFLESHNGNVCYQKTDFRDFYGNIVKKVLIEKLKYRIKDHNAIILISRAINTPVISDSFNPHNLKVSHKGIPQGLSISNILAQIYMIDYDRSFGQKAAQRYFRYVDDILYLEPYNKSLMKDMKKHVKHHKLGLQLALEKNTRGNLRQRPFEYLGYVFSCENDKVLLSVKKAKVSMFLSKVAGIVSRCAMEYENKGMRSDSNLDNTEFIEFYKDELNMQISGFKFNGHLYGWMAYYQGITNMKQLHSIDYHINKIINYHCPTDTSVIGIDSHNKGIIPQEIINGINSIVKTYYDIIGNAGNSLMINFDNYKTVEEKRSFLRQKRKKNIDSLDDDQIIILFDRYVYSLIRRSQLNIGDFS